MRKENGITQSLPKPTRGDNVIYENAAVGAQLGVDRNDMLAPGKSEQSIEREKKKFFFNKIDL